MSMSSTKDFLEACKEGNLVLVESLLESIKIRTLHSSVWMASENGHLEVVKYLVENGADFRVLDNRAVRHASVNGHIEVVKYLVEKGADFRARDNHAVTAASANGHLEVVKYLVEKGADFRACYDYAIRIASTCGNLEIVKYLVEMGADFRALDNQAVRWASHNGHLEVVKYLIGKGAPEDGISSIARDYIRKIKTKWCRVNHLGFSEPTNELFGCLFLGIQRLEETGELMLAHQAMLEEILQGWTAWDDFLIQN